MRKTCGQLEQARGGGGMNEWRNACASWLRHCKCATCDMLHALGVAAPAIACVCLCVCMLRRVVNKRQVKCHYVLRAVTMANLLLSLSHSLSCIYLLSLSFHLAMRLHIAHTPRCTAETERQSSLTICWHIVCKSKNRSAGHMSSQWLDESCVT